MTYALNMQERAQLPRSWMLEHAGVEIDPDTSFSLWSDDQMAIAEVQADTQRILQQPELEAQQQIQQAQEEQAQAEQAQAVENPAQLPEAQFAPTNTRESTSGRTVAGGETAGG